MKEVDDDDVDGQPPALVLPRHGKKLLLGLVAELALPKAQAVLGHHGRRAGDRGIGCFDLLGAVSGHQPVVQDFGGVGLEAHDVLAQHRPAHGGVVPEEAVAERREKERHRSLGIPVGQLQVRALEVQIGLLVLSHAVELFPGVQGLKPGGQVVVAAGDGLEFPALHLDGAALGIENVPAIAVILLQELFPILIVGRQLAAAGEVDGELAVDETVAGFGFLDFGLRTVRLGERPIFLGHLSLLPSADADSVFAPGLDAQGFGIAAVNQSVFFDSKQSNTQEFYRQHPTIPLLPYAHTL